MRERLLGRGSYGLFESKMLDDYCEHGLIATGEGIIVSPAILHSKRRCIGPLVSMRASTIVFVLGDPGAHSSREDASARATQDGLHYFSDMAKTGGRIQKWL